MSQLTFMISFAGMRWGEPKGADAEGWGPLDRLYATESGHFYLAAHGSQALKIIATVIGLEEIDELAAPDLDAALEAWLQTLPAATRSWACRIRRRARDARRATRCRDSAERASVEPFGRFRALPARDQWHVRRLACPDRV